MVRSIERVLGDRVERRILEGFDYKKQMPGRDTEFARPPHKPQQRKEQKKTKPSGSRPATSAPQKKHGGGREEKHKFGGGEARKPLHRSASHRGYNFQSS
jgi:hypothetical protein